jgi:hypothetical protein
MTPYTRNVYLRKNGNNLLSVGGLADGDGASSVLWVPQARMERSLITSKRIDQVEHCRPRDLELNHCRVRDSCTESTTGT